MIGEDNLIERIRIKVKNLEADTDEPVPETFTFNNIIHGEVVKRFRNELSGTHQFDVKFELNGMPVDVSVQLSWSEIEAAGDRKSALMALAKVISTKLAMVLVEKVVKTEAEYQLKGTIR